MFHRYYAWCFTIAARLTRVQGYAAWLIPMAAGWGAVEWLRTLWMLGLFAVIFAFAATFAVAHHRYWQGQSD